MEEGRLMKLHAQKIPYRSTVFGLWTATYRIHSNGKHELLWVNLYSLSTELKAAIKNPVCDQIYKILIK